MDGSIDELSRHHIKPGQKLLKMLLTQTEELPQSWTDGCSTAPSPLMVFLVLIGLFALIVKLVSSQQAVSEALRKRLLPAPAGMLP